MATILTQPKVIPTPYEIILNGLDSSDAWGPEMEKVVRIAADLASEYRAVMDLMPESSANFVAVPFEECEMQVVVTEVFDWAPMAYPLDED
jgi:hypothetical protein